VEPAGNVGGDTFDYSLDRDTLHVSLTDAMGHEEDAALLASLLVGSLRNSRRSGATLAEQAARANSALLQHARPDQFVTGQLLRVDLTAGTAAMVNAGHPHPLRTRDGRVEDVGGKLRDDATALCLDWYGGGERDREVDAGANQHGASAPRADS
jgi:serine phosphatase RsbU (regulator of sigma subunit)